MSYYEKFSLGELVTEKIRLERELEKMGKTFDSLSGNEYWTYDGALINSKEQIGCDIYSTYSAIGAVNERMRQLVHAI